MVLVLLFGNVELKRQMKLRWHLHVDPTVLNEITVIRFYYLSQPVIVGKVPHNFKVIKVISTSLRSEGILEIPF